MQFKMKIKSFLYFILIGILAFIACSCSNAANKEKGADTTMHSSADNEKIHLNINGKNIDVIWENNASVNSLKKKLKNGDLRIFSKKYGGFEQVASLGFSLPTSDRNLRASSGDIMLYNADKIVLFYGNNDWSYTKLGKISNLSKREISNILNTKSTNITLSISK